MAKKYTIRNRKPSKRLALKKILIRRKYFSAEELSEWDRNSVENPYRGLEVSMPQSIIERIIDNDAAEFPEESQPIYSKGMVEQLYKAIDVLTLKQRTIMRYFLAGLTYEEIAQEMGIKSRSSISLAILGSDRYTNGRITGRNEGTLDKLKRLMTKEVKCLGCGELIYSSDRRRIYCKKECRGSK